MKKNIKYDTIIPIGCSCVAAQALRENKKRSRSFPLDWIKPTHITSAVDFLENHFRDFFNKEDLQRKQECDNRKNIGYINARTNLLFVHDFKSENTFDEEYELVKEKYNRRIERIYQTVNEKQNILFFYVHVPLFFKEKILEKEIISAYHHLLKIFPHKNIHLLCVSLDGSGDGYIKKELADNIDYVSCFECQTDETDENFLDYCKYRPNMNKLLKAYQVKKSYKDYMYKFFYKVLDALCKLLPAKKIKEKVRMMYKEYK